MGNEKKLFLLDGFALIYRAYFAFVQNPRINSKGLDTSAIFGFTNTLNEVLRKQNPSHIAVVFDRSAPTERHIEYPEYKAQRDAMPEGIKDALPYIDRLLEAFNIPKLYKDGFEADDVIGTLAKKAEQKGYKTYMMTSDKDFAQLVSENIFMYRPGNKWQPTTIWGIPEVLEKFDIARVDQVIDFLGMMGDSADNIPGIPGVGEKTAQKFLKQFDTMEGLFANSHELKGKMKESVESSEEIGLLCKKLVTIITDVPIKLNEDNCACVAKLRNKAVEISSGEYIMNVDSDDILYSDAIEYLISNAQKRNLDLVYGSMTYIDEYGSPIKQNKISGDKYEYGYLIKKMFIPFPRMYKKDTFNLTSGYNEKYSIADDLDLYLQLEEKTNKIG